VKVRVVKLILCLVMSSLCAGLLPAAAAPARAGQAASGLAVSWASAGAVTSTVRLPLVLNCYPQQGTDPYFSYQYDMRIINAEDAWGPCRVNAGEVTIAIIDTGVDLEHPDLQANLLSGYDFVDNDTVPEDGNGHGTNVAGIAAAALNGIGVAGVAPTAKILPVRVLDNSGSGYISDIASGIVYAADRAEVLNLSLGSTSSSQTLLDAINYAVNTQGRLVVAAAGNCGDLNYPYNGCAYQNQTVYPAAYSGVIAVAATTSYDTRASFSNVGSYVDLAAPGVSIYNTYYGNSYTYESGTSQATPHVSGLAALVWAQNPTYTAAQVWNQIASTAVDLGAPGFDTSFGAGRIDVQQALGLTALPASLPEVNPAKAVEAPLVDQRAAPIAPGRIIVKFKEAIGEQSAARVLGALPNAAADKSIPAVNARVLRVPAGTEWQVIDQLRSQPEVEYAEPDYLLQLIR
jgi:subtilisin family serine protease